MDEKRSKLYYELKEAYRNAIKNISEDTINRNNMPVIIIDFYSWGVHYFNDELEAEEYVRENYTTGWDIAPNGLDKKLVTIKFFTEKETQKNPHIFGDLKFIKEVSWTKIFRVKSFVEFEIEEFHINRGLEIAINVVI